MNDEIFGTVQPSGSKGNGKSLKVTVSISILRELEVPSRGNSLISCRLALSGDSEIRAAGLKWTMWWKGLPIVNGKHGVFPC